MRYYSLQKPITIGTIPSEITPINIFNYNMKTYIEELGCEICGYAEYAEQDEEKIEKKLISYDLLSHSLLVARKQFNELVMELKKYEHIHAPYELFKALNGYNYCGVEFFDFKYKDLCATVNFDTDIIELSGEIEYYHDNGRIEFFEFEFVPIANVDEKKGEKKW